MATKPIEAVKLHFLRESHRPSDHRLGRHIVHDPRSLKFPAQKAPQIKSVTHEGHGLPLDQGQVGACTAFAGCATINCDPYFNPLRGVLEGATALELYHDETELHPQYGVYTPDDPGGSGLWIAKVLKNRGLIKGYGHAFGLEHALKALVLRPCIFGVNWYSSFDDVDLKTGLVEIGKTARIDGGHEICAFGIDTKADLVWFWQSWGAWGQNNSGRFCMRFDTVDRLLRETGDCTQFVPLAKAKKK